MDTIDYRNVYGAVEVNGLAPGEQQRLLDELDGEVDWTEKGLRIVRLRMLTDPGFPLYDVSYIYGRTADGKLVRVRVPFFQLTKRKWKSEIIEHAKRDGVYAKGLGIFDDGVVSTLC